MTTMLHTHLFSDMPESKQLNFQDPASPMMEQIIMLHDYTMFILMTILTFIMWMLMKTTTRMMYWRNMNENTKLEMMWTMLPAIMLTTIAYPSLKLLYATDESMEPELTIKSMGNQWYWSYEYSDYENKKMEFASYMMPTEELKMGDNRLLEVDNRLMIPMNTNMRMLITAADVLHSFTMPSLGMKADAMPGRLNQVNFLTSRPGMFYGQCSELCGTNHSFMPMVMESTNLKNYSYFIHTET
uniref:Cytochrome c oxidase subunit 2 n=1 Tax=Oopsacas minuta TaxID=111878 RepID=A0A0G3ZAS9_9METZ|nr:cytochrome c oxidase subunit II [Oopsacas minuta]AKM54871.1 cytochrome c oxidase subunit 2 [Oopsacas minuta]